MSKYWKNLSRSVKVIKGKYRGKVAVLVKVFPRKDLAIVRDVNVALCAKKSSEGRNGEFYRKELCIHLSNLQYL